MDAWQWKPDMIWFDNLSVVRTPNYYVQQMVGQNTGTHVLDIQQNGSSIVGQDSLYASAVLNETSSAVIVKAVNASSEIKEITVSLKGLKGSIQNARVEITELHSNDPEAVNSLDNPNLVVPVFSFVQTDENSFTINARGNSFYVCKLKIN